MKKVSIKLLAAVLTLCLILCGTMVVVAATTDLTEAAKDGIQVKLSTDKDIYKKDEQVTAMLTIENGGSEAVWNVKSVITLPSALDLSNGSLSQDWGKLSANAQKWHTVVLSSSAAIDPTVPPDTGDDFPMWMAILTMVVSAGGLCVLLVTGKLKLDRSFCLLLLAMLLVMSLVPVVGFAEESVNQIQVSKEVSIDGTSVTMSAVVTYDNVEEPDTITRADMETALAEVAWDHYIKDVWFQYDSADLNSRTDGSNLPMSRWVGGFTRLSNYLDMVYFIRDGVRIGAAQYNTYQSEDGKCFILDYWVFPEFRGGGTGHRCFEALEAHAKADGALYYELNCTRENAHRFWRSLGFVDNDLDEYDMALMVRR